MCTGDAILGLGGSGLLGLNAYGLGAKFIIQRR
jgi:hypothetical protein